jgi:hypothetical protein
MKYEVLAAGVGLLVDGGCALVVDRDLRGA